jgi:FtsP/CotA-like multicopper oxidase with cupredoxin domain
MKFLNRGLFAAAIPFLFLAVPVQAQDSSIYVQCPSTDINGNPIPEAPGVKCKHISGGDGMVTMADDAGKKLYIFSFADIPLPGQDEAPNLNTGEYPGWVMEHGLLNANAPAPTIVVDEDDELYLSLTNVGMAMRPDLFDPHTVHWHGFPQASSIFDGVPDSSISINMGATLTYYYKAMDAGTYMYHCHVEATEHMQMGMLGNLFVRPRQNRCPIATGEPGAGLPGSSCPEGHTTGDKYAYNDGDGTTAYDVEHEIQIGSFDPAFHDASLNVQPLPFAGMKDRYFLLNGRGYPDTVKDNEDADTSNDMGETIDPLGTSHYSQPVSSLVVAAPGERILLRISNLNVTQFYTLGTNGLTMKVIALDARLLRDDDGVNRYYDTNSLTIGGGQSADVIIEAPATTGTYFLYTQNLDQLSNDNENFGGMMTEIHVR